MENPIKMDDLGGKTHHYGFKLLKLLKLGPLSVRHDLFVQGPEVKVPSRILMLNWTYCWWKKSQTTTWDGEKNPINNGRIIIQTVVQDFVHQQYFPK